ncbi:MULTISPECIES: ABC transporter ATP-binding protein [Gordonibacter]|uniref:ABC transporter ATP-binding protein n=1 Tax=Gordonibacter faecis TaxID=3047475 RepID=A0ABT7DPR8_9ACTN|nr:MULTISPECIES: ABC transporter ATP-binding protein [unclassified Gordonibacter]MDJ1650506.1 ABC transporter ATP-binding protein [Gordonibacter sp. KGMB12511]HIW76378.1 ABC transporter ATP-binding protein [Candidatus Gordonibacter avicola]
MGAIRIEYVSFSYDDALGARPAETAELTLDDISLEIPDGQFLCLIGHSGSGKTTLLRLLAGLNRPREGRILIDGVPVKGPGLDRAVVFQNYALFPWMTARGNVEFGIQQANKEFGRGLSKAQVKELATEYLQRVDMLEAATKYPYQLSGGMRQRVAIARALAIDADILLFDEPFGALDVKTRCSLQKLIDRLWRSGEHRKTVVFVTHDIDEAILLSDRVVFMRRGELVADRRVDVARPRSSAILVNDERARTLKEELTELFYLDGPEEEPPAELDALPRGEVVLP